MEMVNGRALRERGSSISTQKGTFFGLAATGKQVSVAGIVIFRLRNGQIVEEWLVTDQLGTMQHLSAKEGWSA